MSYNKAQFKSLIERVLNEYLRTLCTPESIQILLGTAAQESGFGKYLRQTGNGPALGVFQMEPATFVDLQTRFGSKFPIIKAFYAAQLEWDLRASIIMARIKYFSCPGPIPKDLQGQAGYWKRWYNTPLGAGTTEEYLENFRRFVG